MATCPAAHRDEVRNAGEAGRLRLQPCDNRSEAFPAGSGGCRRDVQSVFRRDTTAHAPPPARGRDVCRRPRDASGGDSATGIAASGVPAGGGARDMPPRGALELLLTRPPHHDLPQKAARMPAALLLGRARASGRRSPGGTTREGGVLLPSGFDTRPSTQSKSLAASGRRQFVISCRMFS